MGVIMAEADVGRPNGVLSSRWTLPRGREEVGGVDDAVDLGLDRDPRR